MNGVGHFHQKVGLASSLVRGGNFRKVSDIISAKSWASFKGIGLRRDLSIPFEAPSAAIPTAVRLLREGDIPQLVSIDGPNLSGASRLERLNRLNMIQAGFRTCYVAVTADGTPCYMQFLIGSDENALLRSHFRGLYPVLAPDEALLEGAFTPEEFRGQRIMPSAMAQIAQMAADFGARWVITYSGAENIASLKGCKRAGFFPFQEREERWRLFRQSISFTPLPPNTLYSFDVQPQAAPQPAAE